MSIFQNDLQHAGARDAALSHRTTTISSAIQHSTTIGGNQSDSVLNIKSKQVSNQSTGAERYEEYIYFL